MAPAEPMSHRVPRCASIPVLRATFVSKAFRESHRQIRPSFKEVGGGSQQRREKSLPAAPSPSRTFLKEETLPASPEPAKVAPLPPRPRPPSWPPEQREKVSLPALLGQISAAKRSSCGGAPGPELPGKSSPPPTRDALLLDPLTPRFDGEQTESSRPSPHRPSPGQCRGSGLDICKGAASESPSAFSVRRQVVYNQCVNGRRPWLCGGYARGALLGPEPGVLPYRGLTDWDQARVCLPQRACPASYEHAGIAAEFYDHDQRRRGRGAWKPGVQTRGCDVRLSAFAPTAQASSPVGVREGRLQRSCSLRQAGQLQVASGG
eukprot:TRINITY_DN81312_c0_g1_i1.p1 TRINITY_DN81312_c0_g1~~TRINITY_DN81312_c0_g1_i1.p1  ORF type:complete len:320 (-),score=49.30 TRINITY_DN81312_c0_g1_i1:71-1030(-)